MKFDQEILLAQHATCARHSAACWPVDPASKVGVNTNLRSGLRPVNGLRHPPEGDTCGWYLWAGEDLTEDPNFFVPLHAIHLVSWCPLLLPYLALPPGWRFLLADGYEDVWFDPDLLSVSSERR